MEEEIASPDTARENRNSSCSDSSSSTENDDTDSTHDNYDNKKGVYELGSANSGSDSPAFDDNAALNSPASAREEPRVTADSDGGNTATAVESNSSKRIVENGRIPTEVASPDDDGGVSQVMIRPRSNIVASASTGSSSGKVTSAQRDAARLLGKLGLSLHVDSVVVRKRARDKVISEGELHSEIGKLVSGADENTDQKDDSEHENQKEDGSNDFSTEPETVQEEKHPDQETIEKEVSIEENKEKDDSTEEVEEKDDSTEEVEEKDDSSEESEDKDDSDKDENSEEDTTDVSNQVKEHRETFPNSVNETVENKSGRSKKGCCCML